MDNIKVFRMLSGDEIIGRVIGETDTTMTLEQPRAVHFGQVQQAANEPPSIQVNFYPLSMIRQSPEHFVVYKAAIFGELLNPAQAIVDGYIEHTSGVQIVRAL